MKGIAVVVVACAGLLGAGAGGAAVASHAVQASPTAGVWTAIAPAIDGPNAKVHTKLHFTVSGGAVLNFGTASAGGSFNSVAGSSLCSALMYFKRAPIQGNSFSATLKLPGGEVIFKGTFTSATTAAGIWEETNPCYTNVIRWTARAGGAAPAAPTNGGGSAGPSSPKPAAGSTPKTWVSTMCGTFLTWEQAAKTGDAKLHVALATLEQSKHASLAQIRNQLASFLGDFAAASLQARAQLAAVGAPRVKDGAQIQQTVLNAFTVSAAFLTRAKASVMAFPTGDPHTFVAKTEALARSITAMFGRVGSSLSALGKYNATALEAAARADATCRKLGG